MNFNRLLGLLEVLPYLEHIDQLPHNRVKKYDIAELSDFHSVLAQAAWAQTKVVLTHNAMDLSPLQISKILTEKMILDLESEMIGFKVSRMVSDGKPIYIRQVIETKDYSLFYTHEPFVVRHVRASHEIFYKIMKNWRRFSLTEKISFLGIDDYADNRNLLFLFHRMDKL